MGIKLEHIPRQAFTSHEKSIEDAFLWLHEILVDNIILLLQPKGGKPFQNHSQVLSAQNEVCKQLGPD